MPIIYYTDKKIERLMAAGIYLLNKGGKFLLQKRGSETNAPNVWGCFGGKSDDQETPQQTAIREFKEESGYEGKFSHLKLIHINKNRDGFIFYSYLAYVPDDIEVTMVGKTTVDGVVEVDDAQYFTLDELMKLDLHGGSRFTFKSKINTIKKYIDEYCKNT